MNILEQLEGCIIGGAIGDAYGSAYENLATSNDKDTFYLFGKPKKAIPKWRITDDTQLTLATCEVIIENEILTPENFAKKYLDYHRQRKISGIGSSTLKSFQELEAGAHWSLVGRKGEYAAGNGAAMRIAPLAFIKDITREQIREICFLTHRNDEAYVGALSVVTAIQSILDGTWSGKENLIEIIIESIPDTRIRDRFIDINKIGNNLKEIGQLGNNGYVVNSIPLALAFANQASKIGIENMYNLLIKIGGDTDTNCSIAGQIVGTLMGKDNIPISLIDKLKKLNEYNWISSTIIDMKKRIL